MNDTERMASSSTVAASLQGTVQRLEGAGIPNALWEARQLVAWALPCLPAHVEVKAADLLSDRARARLSMMVGKRIQHVPLAYVLGEWDFMDLVLEVTPDVLIPRPETEQLAERVIRELNAKAKKRDVPVWTVADVGTGSGCLAAAIGKHVPGCMVLALDVSPRALQVARRNIQRLNLSQKVIFMQGDLLTHLMKQKAPFLDAVVANVPYVTESDLEGLAPEVRQEPEMALNGGRDGLTIFRRLIPQAFATLNNDGRLYLEVGLGQDRAVVNMLKEAGFTEVSAAKDMAGVKRFVSGTKP